MDSIADQYPQQLDNYLLVEIGDGEQCLKLNIGKRKKFTVLEGCKIYQLLGASKFRKISVDVFKNIEKQRHVPERTFEQIRNFWKEYSDKTLETFLTECIFFEYDYCLSFKEFPDRNFVIKHKQQFADEFYRL